jgi:predicted XRE-type DNA-binding protein
LPTSAAPSGTGTAESPAHAPIYRLIKQRGIAQTEAGKVLGSKQPHVSGVMRNRAGSFSVERLMNFLTTLGQDVEITVRPTRKPHGAVSVVA